MPKTEGKIEATGKIKIIKTPEGEAPLEVRECWVGLELPCLPQSGYYSYRGRGVLTGKQPPIGRSVVIVPQKEALEILAKTELKAAEWWCVHGFPESISETTGFFEFGENEVEVIGGVKPIPIHKFAGADMEGEIICVHCGAKEVGE